MKKIFYHALLALSFGLFSPNQLQSLSTGTKQSPQPTRVPAPAPTPNRTFAYQTFDEWKAACDALPFYRNAATGNFTNKPEQLTYAEVKQTLDLFAQTLQKSALSNPTYWVDNNAPTADFFNVNRTTQLFQPYAEKLVIPIGSQVAFHGDLHGDVKSLVVYLQNLKEQSYLDNTFKIIKDNFYIVFLGDYVDRGNYGIEVIYTLMRLKIANPEKVVLVRGNHEDSGINLTFNFGDELRTKFPETNTSAIHNLYNLLPVVLYLGSGETGNVNFIQCCHGGLELGYLPKQLLNSLHKIGFEWIKELKRDTNFMSLNFDDANFAYEKDFIMTTLNGRYKHEKKEHQPNFSDFTPDDPFYLGFLWSDFHVEPPEDIYSETSPENLFVLGRGWKFGPALTKAILKESSTNKNKLVGIFRAHQHSRTLNPMMNCIFSDPDKGVCKLWKQTGATTPLWENIVITHNLAPDSAYGAKLGFTFDTYGLLTTGKRFPQDWQLDVKTIEVVPKTKKTN